MFYSKAKKEALHVHERAVERYNKTYAQMQSEGESLYLVRQKSLELVQKIEELINSIANSPMYELLNSGKVKAYKNGRIWRIPKEALKEYILSSAKLA